MRRVAEELYIVEKIFLSQVAQEVPELYNELAQKLRNSAGRSPKTHFAALNTALTQA